MPRTIFKLGILALLFGSFSSIISADEKIDFEMQVGPILKLHCNECHGNQVREGGLRFTNRHDALLETDSGSFAIVASKPSESTMIDRITSADDSVRMPPEGEPLSEKEVETLRKWVAEGAVWPELKTERHWAYVTPKKPVIPKVVDSQWPKNEIDFFVLKQLEKTGLQPSPESAPARLLRRTSLVLTGLPPTVEQVDQFLAEPTEEVYENFVNQCLDSKRYGEHWAQPWLDLARYADSNGYQADQLRESWAYRDWVINALNSDMPFDQFAVEQLAGDLLPNATPDQKIATGFHRTVTCNVEAGVHPEENRVNQIFDRVNTTGTVFLGTTIECCQCHNHKYDPFTQDEYYQLFAFFNNTPVEVKLVSGVQYNFNGPRMELPLVDEEQVKLDSLRTRIEELESKQKRLAESSNLNQEATKRELAALVAAPIAWKPLVIVETESTGGETLTTLDDYSLLVGGSFPGTTTYTIKATSDLDSITAFKLEALTHESLPGTGPGRGDAVRANFILSEFNVARKDNRGGTQAFKPVKLVKATADFSQTKWDVANAIDGDQKTGWAVAPKFFVDHYAIFEIDQPLKRVSDLDKYRFLLDQNYGRGRTMGRVRISATSMDPRAFAIPESIKEILVSDQPTKKQTKELEKFLVASDPESLDLQKEINKVKKAIEALKPPSTLVMVEMDEMRETFKMSRGEYLSPSKKVSVGVPAVLHAMDESLPRNRLGLAKWIADPSNPLIGRVTVNRWWTNMFGNGLVASGEDFGTQSEAPTHPELLDWLATEFVENGWSQKHIHKLIVMSSTFRQSSKLNRELLELDPKNLAYTRGPRFRMSAETIRDNGLAISGLLSTRMGGPPIMPFQPENIWRSVGRNAPKWKEAKDADRFRRGVYVVWRRAAPYPSFVNFDAPDRAACVVKRPRTNTPLQALTLLNDKAYLEMAVALAKKIQTELPTAKPRDQISAAMRKCVLRMPKDSELDTLLEFYQTELARFERDPTAAKELLMEYGFQSQIKNSNNKQMAALSLVANVLLNLDETINY